MPDTSTAKRRSRASFLQFSDFERLDGWAGMVRAAFPRQFGLFLVGSVLTTPNYRDVDLRMILRDAWFDRLFDDIIPLRMFNRAFSAWGQRDTGLPIDFQFQRQSDAPDGLRNPMGVRDPDHWPMPQGVTFHRRKRSTELSG